MVVSPPNPAQLSTERPGPQVAEFHGIEGVQEASVAADWTLEYRQLEAGLLKARTVLCDLTEVSLMREGVNRRMELVGESPTGMLTVGVRISGNPLKINSHVFDDGKLLVIAPGAELHAVTGSSADVITMHVPESLLVAHSNVLFPDCQDFTRGQAVVVQVGVEQVDLLRRHMFSYLQPTTCRKWEPELASVLLTHFLLSLRGVGRRSGENGAYHNLHQYRILRRAREYIEEHLNEPIRIADVCRYAGASLSTLGRVFRREINTTPSKYIQARRLNAVRRVITGDEAANHPITRIALDYGFNHLGRFSMAYRCHFGQSPSEVRRGARWQYR